MTASHRLEVDPRAVLGALKIGATVWLRAQGNSMWPLVRSGARLRVRKTTVSSAKPGDIGVILLPRDRLVAHIVERTAPLVSVSVVGVVDPPGTWLGRVEAVEEGGVRVPIPGGMRHALRVVPLAARRLRRSQTMRKLAGWLREFVRR